MDDIMLALLGNQEAARRLTDAGVLLPCPFCGKKPTVEYDDPQQFEYAIICQKCAAYTTCSNREIYSRLAWNTRAPILSESEMEMLDESRPD